MKRKIKLIRKPRESLEHPVDMSDQRSVTISTDLPITCPPHLGTCSVFEFRDGSHVQLRDQEVAAAQLVALDAAVQPVLASFHLYYHGLSELARAGKPAVTERFFLRFLEEDGTAIKAVTHHIRVRVRRGDDPAEFYNQTTLTVLLLHEVAHIKYMSHGRRFRNLLEALYESAMSAGLLASGEPNQAPSKRVWERELYTPDKNV